MEALDVATATSTSFSAADSGRSAIVDVVTCGATTASAVEAMEADENERETGSAAEERCSVAGASSAFIVFVAGGAAVAGADGAMETLDVATATGTSFSAADSGRSASVDVVTCGATAASAVGAMHAEEAASETGSPAEECCSVVCAN